MPTKKRTLQREERIFLRGKQAAASLVRALEIPDRRVQLATAQLLIEARARVGEAIAEATESQGEHVRGAGSAPLTQSLAAWYHEIGSYERERQYDRSLYGRLLEPEPS